MSFPTPQQPAAQPGYPPPAPAQPYRASTRSRVIVWTIAIVLLGTLVTFLGASVFRAVSENSRENQLASACEQEALNHLRPNDAAAAAFTPPKVTKLPDDRAHVASAVRLPHERKPFTCEGRWDGNHWTITDLQFS